jgi:glycosyltransferase involved in cell wall biosynthesis
VSLGLTGEAHADLTDFQPDLFHIATPDLLGLAALWTARKWKTPVVASYHTHFASYLDYYRLGILEGAIWSYMRWFYRQCLHVYVPTKSMEAVLRSHGIDGNLRLWPRGVDSMLFNPAKRSNAWRAQRGIADSEIVVAFVSRLVAEKGLNVVVDVMRGLSDRHAAYRALIVGDGPERKNIESSMPNAIFEGHLTGEELATAYASSDVFLFPSETETFGNVTLEALSSGLPAVVANATGSNALVQDSVNGFLVEPRNQAAFLERVHQLVKDGELRRRMGTAARISAESYDWSAVLDQIAGYYEEIG